MLIYVTICLGGSILEKAFLKKTAIQSVAIMLGVIMLSFAIEQYNSVAIKASNNEDIRTIEQAEFQNDYQDLPKEAKVQEVDTLAAIETLEEPRLIFTGAETNVNNDILKQLGDKYIVIRKPHGEAFQITMEDLYITKNLKLNITGHMDEIPDVSFIGRVNGKDIYIGEPEYLENEILEQEDDGTVSTIITRDYGNDPVNDISISNLINDKGQSELELMLLLDHVYVHILYEDEFYYYIDLKKPKDVYDRIIVIDAGHGGKDPGAISRDELTYEKEINLNILLELKKHLDRDNIKVYYTRLLDNTIFLRPRVTLANDVDCDFFISIHNNANKSTRANGTEILYYNQVSKNISIKDMAKIFLDEITKVIPLKNNGLMQMKDDDIFILSNATVPAILIECGYMSNNKDLEYLKSKAGQLAFAEGIYKGILRAYEVFMPYMEAEE